MPVVTDRNGKVCNFVLRVISITTYGNNGVFSILFYHSDKGKCAFIVDVREVINQFFRKSMKGPQKTKVY